MLWGRLAAATGLSRLQAAPTESPRIEEFNLNEYKIVVPELMRILVDEQLVEWDKGRRKTTCSGHGIDLFVNENPALLQFLKHSRGLKCFFRCQNAGPMHLPLAEHDRADGERDADVASVGA